MKICIQGLGYVGATTAVLLASKLLNNKPQFQIIGLEKKNKTGLDRLTKLKKYKFPFESNDNNIFKSLNVIKKKKNFFPTFNKKYLSKVDIIIVSMGLDLNKNRQDFNDRSFLNGIRDIANQISENTLVVIQSTVPIGYTRKIIKPLLFKLAKKRGIDCEKIYLAHSYERVTPGKNYLNSISNSHRVYSGINKISKKLCKKFLEKFINYKKYPLTELENTDASELSKILENSFRAINIALIEEWRKFSEYISVDLEKIISGIKLRDSHKNIMLPGLGVGGYCLTKDPLFAKLSAKKIFNKNMKFNFSSSAVATNTEMLNANIEKVKKILNKNKIKRKKILLFGLSYKADVDDLRHSPALSMAETLKKNKHEVYFFDNFIKKDFEGIRKLKNLNKINNFDLIIFAVNHENFKKLNFNNLKINKKTVIYDANLVLTNQQESILRKKTEHYYKIGKN
jgi:UDP-N-acetyl-D-glucosamine dehydrogenase